jgi:hypothetical protein
MNGLSGTSFDARTTPRTVAVAARASGMTIPDTSWPGATLTRCASLGEGVPG